MTHAAQAAQSCQQHSSEDRWCHPSKPCSDTQFSYSICTVPPLMLYWDAAGIPMRGSASNFHPITFCRMDQETWWQGWQGRGQISHSLRGQCILSMSIWRQSYKFLGISGIRLWFCSFLCPSTLQIAWYFGKDHGFVVCINHGNSLHKPWK